MTKPVKHKAKDIIEAIRGSGGIKTTIARRLGVHRNTVNNYLERYSTVQQAYDNEVASIGDMAETVIIKAMEDDSDVSTAKWYAKNKLKHRGYVERQEHTGADGKDLEIVVRYADD